MTDGFDVDPAALRLAAQGINNTVDELSEMGMLSSGQVGRGFGSLELSGMEAGHPGLAEAVAAFTERWGWGVRNLVADANKMAVSLDLAAGRYHDMDQYVSDSLSNAGRAVVGNPHATEQELAQQSWSEVGASYTPDYSLDSFEESGEESSEAWQGAVEDVIETQKERFTDPGSYYAGEADALMGKGPEEGAG